MCTPTRNSTEKKIVWPCCVYYCACVCPSLDPARLPNVWGGAVGWAKCGSILFIWHHLNAVARKLNVVVEQASLPPWMAGVRVVGPASELGKWSPTLCAVAVLGIVVVKAPWVIFALRSANGEIGGAVTRVPPTHDRASSCSSCRGRIKGKCCSENHFDREHWRVKSSSTAAQQKAAEDDN